MPEFPEVEAWRRQLDAESLAPILASDSRRLHSLLRDQRLIAGIGRAWANEILHTAKLSPYALSGDLDDEETARLAAAIHSELERGLARREAGASDEKTYRTHRRLGEPCHVCGTPIAQVDFDRDDVHDWLQPGEVNVGYFLFAPARGKGYASRAVGLLLELLTRDTEHTAATLLIHPENGPSLALAHRLAFTRTADVDGQAFFRRDLG